MFYIDFLKELYHNHIQYLIVGGVAVNLHGVPRATFDFDLVISTDKENVLALLQVLKNSKYIPSVPENPMHLADPEKVAFWIREKNVIAFSFFNEEHSHQVVDIILKHPLDFQDAFSRKVTKSIDDFELYLASIEDLIVMKRESARPKDMKDIEFLNRAREFNEKTDS